MDRQQTTLSTDQQRMALGGTLFPLQFLVNPSWRQTVRDGNRELAKLGDSAMFHRFHDLFWTLREPEVVALLTEEERAALVEFNAVFSKLPWREIEGRSHINKLPDDDLSPLAPSGERLYRLLEARTRASTAPLPASAGGYDGGMEKPPLGDRLFFALACYASVLAWVAFWLVLSWFMPEGLDLRGRFTGGILWLFFTLPIPGALIGLGTGGLSDHGTLGAIAGFALALFIQLATLAAGN
jgi:hypothetical protein